MKTSNVIENVRADERSANFKFGTARRRFRLGHLGLVILCGLILTGGGMALSSRPADETETPAEEGAIAQVTARLLEQAHYTGHRFDNALASRFLDRYLDLLDGTHLHFLEADVAEFAPLRTTLDALTLRNGDTSPAIKIFDRFQTRFAQRIAYVQALLRTEKFEFEGSDSFAVDREHAPRPRDLAAAKLLWQQHLRYEYLQELLSDKPPAEIVKTLSRRYERLAHTAKQWSHERVFELYLTALANAYDPHSDYLGPRQMEDFSIAMNLALVGIGATLQSEDGYCKIQELVAGGPAARSRLLKPGDRIVAVAQAGQAPVDVIDLPLPEAVSLIRGPKGTRVQLTIIPADAADAAARKTIMLVRDEIKLEDQEAKARIVDLPGEHGASLRVGILDLPSFYSGVQGGRHGEVKSATADVAKLIGKLKRENIQGLILDLRRNGGGSLEEAVSLTGLFIQQGPVVQTKDAAGEVAIERDPDPAELYDGPLIVLTSRLSASASEILAGALQDYGRALIVGDPATFGKGTVQSVLPLAPIMRQAGLAVTADPGALKLTIRKFYRPDGASTQLKGVASDLVLAAPTGKLRFGEAEMTNPLPWDQVSPARHACYNLVTPYLATLKANSRQRLAADKDFIGLAEDLERLQKQIDHPVVSLNVKQRRAEKALLEERAAQRKRELATRQPPGRKQYAITLRNADAAGLPEAMRVTPAPRVTAARDAGTSENEDGLERETDSGRDLSLEETERILADYVTLGSSPQHPNLTAAIKNSVARQIPGRN